MFAADLLAFYAAAPLMAQADEAVQAVEAPVAPGGVNPAEVAIVLAPIVLYGIFNLYRAKMNPKAGPMDFLFICGAAAVFANIGAILIYRVRLF